MKTESFYFIDCILYCALCMWCDHISDTKNDTSVSGDMKQHAVRTYWKMVQKETIPGSVIQVAAWVSVKHIFSSRRHRR